MRGILDGWLLNETALGRPLFDFDPFNLLSGSSGYLLLIYCIVYS